jgi:type I site-specific restriction endonuclease
MITTGFDFPALKNIVMARPTKSLALYTQIIGRATRPLDGVVDFDDSTPETRKQRIAESAKPNFRVIDLVDNSLNHKLITTVDVLGGKWSLAMREEVFKEALAKGREVDLTEEMLAIIRAKELEEERRLRAARAARQAQATFANVAVDPFGDQRGTVRDRQQRDMATEKQCRYLWVLGFKDINSYSLTKAQAGRAIHQLKELGMSVQEVKRTNKLRPTSEQQLMPATAKQTPQPIHPAGDDEMFSLFR